MTIPGAGGQQQRPFNAPAGQATPVGVQPGTQAGITFARAVVVFGPTGAVNGIFIYQAGTTPANGNGPVLSGTLAPTDPYKNTVQQGWVSYASPGSAAWGALLNGELQLNSPGSVAPGTVAAFGAGNVLAVSGTTGAADAAASFELQSKNASGLAARVAALAVDQLQLTAGASAKLPLAHLSQFPISGAATLATTIAAANAMYAALVTAQVFAS